MNKILLHVEGFAVLGLSIFMYSYSGFSWVLFILLLFVPDVAMFGYLFNNKIGAIIYNIFHTYSISIAIILFGMMVDSDITLAIGMIWLAHIGMDRMVGYGLKYPKSFKDNHLQRV